MHVSPACLLALPEAEGCLGNSAAYSGLGLLISVSLVETISDRQTQCKQFLLTLSHQVTLGASSLPLTLTTTELLSRVSSGLQVSLWDEGLLLAGEPEVFCHKAVRT